MEYRGNELVERYKANYRIADDFVITEDMILKHWELEKRLTQEILMSTPENRFEVSEHCYTRLFSELDWLNEALHQNMDTEPSEAYGDWKHVVGLPPKRIYEIGSGKGELIGYLAGLGFDCKGTEVTRERGEKWASSSPNLLWGVSDGVHLDQFEQPETYDVVISNQVIEHLHPDDVVDHFRGVLSILVRGGKYIFTTPHPSIGPSDISKLFGYSKSAGMHLKEYTYCEIHQLAADAGFERAIPVIRLPKKCSVMLHGRVKPKATAAYLLYLCFLEKLIDVLPRQELRRKAAGACRLILFNPTIMMVAEKSN